MAREVTEQRSPSALLEAQDARDIDGGAFHHTIYGGATEGSACAHEAR